MNQLNYRIYRFRFICLILALFVLSIFTVGGCNNNNNGGNSIHGVVLGDHREEALIDLRNAMDIGEHEGEPNHIHLDGLFIQDLTQEEIELIREAFNEGFIISVYDVNDAVIAFLYQIVLNLPDVHEELEDPANSDIGDVAQVFTIEQHGGVIWTSMSHDDITDLRIRPDSDMVEGERPPDTFGPFAHHAFHKRQWIEKLGERRQKLIEDGLLSEDGIELNQNPRILDELRALGDDIATRDSDVSLEVGGESIISLTSTYLQSNQFHIGFTNSRKVVGGNDPDASAKNTYQMVTQAYITTADTNEQGLKSFLFVSQDFTLASANGFNNNPDTAQDGFPKQQGWYLSEYKNINTVKIGSETLEFPEAELLDHSPETNQAESASQSVSTSTSFSGTLGFDSSGSKVSLTGGLRYTSSTSFSKQNVAVANLSLSQTTTGNDASWRYRPRKAEILDDKCNNSLFNLADLAHNTFTPSQGWIMRIDGSRADQTLKIITQITLTLTNSVRGNCFVGCRCESLNQGVEFPFTDGTFNNYTMSIHIPAVPDS